MAWSQLDIYSLGIIESIYFLPLFLFKRNRHNIEIVAKGNLLPSLTDLFNMLITFGLTTLAWVFFRADNLNHSISYLSTIFSRSIFEIPSFGFSSFYVLQIVILIVFLFVIEWLGRENNHGLAKFGFRWKRICRLAFYFGITFLIAMYIGKEQQFIYFQF